MKHIGTNLSRSRILQKAKNYVQYTNSIIDSYVETVCTTLTHFTKLTLQRVFPFCSKDNVGRLFA